MNIQLLKIGCKGGLSIYMFECSLPFSSSFSSHIFSIFLASLVYIFLLCIHCDFTLIASRSEIESKLVSNTKPM